MHINKYAASRRKTLIGLAAALLTGSAAAGILAGGSFAANKVTVTLQGTITPECAITGNNTASPDIGDITKPGSKETNFTVNCNTPFRYRLTSLNGGFQHEAAGAGAGAAKGFTTSVPYNVAVVIPTDDIPIRDTCGSASIKAGQITCPFSDSRNGIAIDATARVTMAWTPPREALLAGQYSDRLTFTVEAKP
jgi:hypothetical protein